MLLYFLWLFDRWAPWRAGFTASIRHLQLGPPLPSLAEVGSGQCTVKPWSVCECRVECWAVGSGQWPYLLASPWGHYSHRPQATGQGRQVEGQDTPQAPAILASKHQILC